MAKYFYASSKDGLTMIAKVKIREKMTSWSYKIEIEEVFYDSGYEGGFIRPGIITSVNRRDLKEKHKKVIQFVFEEL